MLHLNDFIPRQKLKMLSREADLPENLKSLSLDTRVPLPWSSLPLEVRDLILAFLPLREVYKARLVCKSFSKVIKRGTFRQARLRIHPTECTLSPLIFYVKGDSWHIIGFEYKSQVWRTLPPIQQSIPTPDPDLVLKDLFVSADKGLFCMNVGKASEAEKLIVYNPLTGETFKLPPLEFSRHPVVINLHVTLAKQATSIVTLSFLVIVVGSAATGTEDLSRKTDVYDSVKGHWEAAGDVPGTDFSLNDYQTGVYYERMNLLLCVGFMVNGNKGILAFNVENRKWHKDWICPFYQLQDQVNDMAALVVHDQVTETTPMVHFAIAQLVQCYGSIYLFTEQEVGRDVTHCIDRLDLDNEGEGFTWTRIVTQQRQGNRALLVYPEYVCVPVAVDKVCIFNTIEKIGVVYDLRNELMVLEPVGIVPTPEVENRMMFHSLNPVGYAFEPTFGVSLE